jgi:FixJ family two-component response regulator
MTNNQDVAIFIVDDDPDVRRALKRLLTIVKFRVEAFATAEEFLSSGHSWSPGVLILDLRLPGMNGTNLQKALADAGSTLPIIFMTAYEDVGVRQVVMDWGAVAFLQKPVDEQTLLAVIQKALQSKGEGKVRRV